MGAKLDRVLTKEQAEIVAVLTARLAHHDANPWRDADTGQVVVTADRHPITIWHSEMDAVVDLLPGKGWEYLRALRAAAGGTVCREYPGIWVRQMLAALRGEIGVDAVKEG